MNKTALYFAMVVVMLDSMGFGLIIPILPNLLAQLGQTNVSGAAGIVKWLTAAYAAMQFLFGPLLGVLSDRFGRKPILVISTGALAIDYIVLATAPALWVLFVGRLVAGIAGATFSTAFAVAADVSTPEQKAANIGLVSAGFGLGFVLGPALGGLIGVQFGPRGPIWAAFAISTLNCLFGLIFFRESLDKTKRQAIKWAKANPFNALLALRYAGSVLTLVCGYFLYALAGNVYPAIWSFYGVARFDWGPGMIGATLFAVGIGFVVTQAVVLGQMLKRFGPAQVMMIALAINILVFSAYAIITQSWAAFVLLPLSALGGMLTPSLNSIIANKVDDTRQGEIQGLLSSMNGLALLCSPFVFSGSFQIFTGDAAPFFWPGVPFALAALLCLAVLPAAFVALRAPQQARGS